VTAGRLEPVSQCLAGFRRTRRFGPAACTPIPRTWQEERQGAGQVVEGERGFHLTSLGTLPAFVRRDTSRKHYGLAPLNVMFIMRSLSCFSELACNINGNIRNIVADEAYFQHGYAHHCAPTVLGVLASTPQSCGEIGESRRVVHTYWA
jgi:hypothetical protein